MTYLGQENDFVKLSYFFSKFEAYFRHLLCVLPACDAFFEFLVEVLHSKYFKFRHCLGASSLNGPKFMII